VEDNPTLLDALSDAVELQDIGVVHARMQFVVQRRIRDFGIDAGPVGTSHAVPGRR
jgi:hypothetical protein